MRFRKISKRQLSFQFFITFITLTTITLTLKPVYSQQTTKRLSILECLEIAMNKNPNIQSAREDVEKSKLQKNEAYSSILPKIHTNFEYLHQNDPPSLVSHPEYPPISMPEDNYTFSLDLLQPLYDQGKFFILKDQAYLSIELSQIDLEIAKQDILSKVISAYINTLKAEEMINIASESKQRLAEHLRVTKRRFEVGQIAKNDVLRAEMELANADSELIHAQKNLFLNHEYLQSLLLIEEHFTTIAFSFRYNLDDAFELEEVLEHAYNNRPDYIKATKTKEFTKKGVSLTKRDFFPFISLFAQYKRTDDEFFPNDDETFIGWKIDLPIYEGDIRRTRLRKARHDLSLADYQQTELKRIIRVDVVEAFLHIEDLEATLRAIDKQIEHAQENLRIVQLRYREGEATNLDVLDANILLVKARIDFITSNYDLINARFALLKARGALNIEKIRKNIVEESK